MSITSPVNSVDLRLAAPLRVLARGRRAMLLAIVVATAGAAFAFAVLAPAGPDRTMEWQLAILLRFMAVVKSAGALTALGLVYWRLGTAITLPTALAYGAGVALMIAAPILIAALAHIVLGALLFHAGWIAVLIVALRDDGPARAWASRQAGAR